MGYCKTITIVMGYRKTITIVMGYRKTFPLSWSITRPFSLYRGITRPSLFLLARAITKLQYYYYLWYYNTIQSGVYGIIRVNSQVCEVSQYYICSKMCVGYHKTICIVSQYYIRCGGITILYIQVGAVSQD